MTNAKKSLILTGAAVVWLASVLVGGSKLLGYASRPGEPGVPSARWPQDLGLPLYRDGATLVLAMHPHCPCTRASLVELNDLVLSLKGRLKVYALVMKPKEFPQGWENTDISSRARLIPGVTVLVDLDGRQAARFGAKTSGEALLYDREGRLIFNGGITEGRGHIGDNAGVQRILSLVRTGKADENHSLVFGCPLDAKSCPLEKQDASNALSLKGAEHGKPSSL